MGTRSTETASRLITETEQGTHTLEVVGYSLKKGIGPGKVVRSGTFTVAGLACSVLFFPDGVTERRKETVVVALKVRGKDAPVVRGSYEFRVLRHDSGLPYTRKGELKAYPSSAGNPYGGVMDIRRDLLELPESGYIKDDRLVVQCVVTIIRETRVSEAIENAEIEVPPSGLSAHFGKLLFEEEGADVAFSVGGETFAAHKLVLATRSPVFKAELYGQMREGATECVAIEDMQASVFRALLHFIYTDALPEMDGLEGDDYLEMIRHLLVAADRYAMDRLKLMCQNILAKNLDVESVATTLALADQHSCDMLKDTCFQFITTSDEIDAMLATKGYANLKRTCPSLIADIFEKTSRLRRK